MKYLNLSSGFNPENALDKDIIGFTLSIFPGGEPNIRIDYNYNMVDDECNQGGWMNVRITHRINTFQDLGVLAMAVNALRHIYPIESLYLTLPYFPGARQDRVCNDGEAFTCEVYAAMINAMDFQVVTIFDPHSDVTPALINNVEVKSNFEFIKAVDTNLLVQEKVHDFHIICPDAGAGKKIIELCKECGFDSMIKCDKTRDLSSGKLSGFEVYAEDLKGKPCLIVDDICDGGGTFIGLAEKLKEKNAGNLYLAVTHGIFSKGPEVLAKHFKKVFTTDSIMNDHGSELIEVINLNEI